MTKLSLFRSILLLLRHVLFATCLLAISPRLLAAGFTISSDTTSSTALTLSSGTGTVNSSITLSVGNTGSATDDIDVTGTSSIVNNGTITQTTTGTNAGRAIRVNTASVTLTITNNAGALIEAADSDPIQVNKGSDSVTMDNFGSVISLNASAGGAQAIDWNAITSGSNTLNNHSTGVLQASEADAVRPGVNGFVNNDGLIKSTTSTGSSSDGIDAQTNTGITIVNAAANLSSSPNLIEGGRHGITGGNTTGTGAYTMSITNNSNGTIQGDNGSGVNIDGINGNELVTITNHGTITGNGHDIGDGMSHDGDGVDVDGLVNLTNTGTIKSLNSFNDTSEGVTVGGGTINNSGLIEGSISSPTGNTGVGRGMTIAGVDKDTNDNPIPVQAPYAATTITNSGTIKGDSDSAIAFPSALLSGFTMTVTNQAGGMIEGGGATAAAIQGGPDTTIINNSGTIKADSSGKAIALGSGNNTLNILGGAASIIGDITGGTGGTNSLVIDPGTGNTFSYAGTITSFTTAHIKSGTFSLSGAMTAGATAVSGGTLAGSGTVTGLVTVTTGGAISPGNSPGKLTLQTGVDFSGGGQYFWQLASFKDDGTGAAGTDFDQILLTGGNLTLGGTSKLTLDFSLLGGGDPNSANPFWLANHTWTIIDGSGATNAGDTNFSQITDASYADGTFTTSSDGNGDTVLKFQSVPEPGTAALLLGTLGSWAGLNRRRRRSGVTPV